MSDEAEDEDLKEMTIAIPLGAIIAGLLAALLVRQALRWKRRRT